MKKYIIITFLVICCFFIACKNKELPKDVKQAKLEYEKNPKDFDSHLIYAMTLHRASDSRSDLDEMSYIELKKIYKKRPDNVEVMAWYGSAMSKMALHTSKTAKKMEYAKNGFELMDEAVERAPNNILVRLIRGINGTRIMEISALASLNRHKLAKVDLEYLLKLAGDEENLIPEEMIVLAKKNLKKIKEQK